MIFSWTNLKKILRDPLYLLKYYKIWKLYRFPRFTETESDLLGYNVKIADSLSFISTYKAIFEKEIYKFKCDTETPLIIDCGSNIGLSIIYFKKLYPRAKIIGFEPDPRIFEILKSNIDSLKYSDVELVNAALWSETATLDFYSDGADGGRVGEKIEEVRVIKVPAVKLSGYLHQKIDFLKIDIEGAEFEVLNESKDLLKNVEKIFIEYHSFASCKQNLHQLLVVLAENNFRVSIANNGFIADQPFIKKIVNLGMDMQLNIFGYKDIS